MTSHRIRSIPAASLIASLFALSAVVAPGAQAQSPQTEVSGSGAQQRIERLTFEDAGTRVDELRVGGQTQSITVQPKADVPAYEIQPNNGTRARGPGRDDSISSPGQRVWNVLKF